MGGRGIRYRMVAFTALVLTVTIGSLAAVGWWYQRQMLSESLESKGMTLAESFSRWMAFPLAAGDREGARRLLEAFATDPDILSVEVIDARGTVLARVGPPLSPGDRIRAVPLASQQTARWQVAQGGVQVYECTHPVVLDLGEGPPKPAGELRLALSWRRGVESLAALRLALFWTSALLVGFGVLLALAAANRLIGPLGRLTTGAERVAGGDLEAAVASGGPGEIGRLADAFNRMTAALREQRARLREMAEREVMRARMDWDATFHAITERIAVHDRDDRVVKANRAFLDWVSRSDVEGLPLRSLVGPEIPLATDDPSITSDGIFREVSLGETRLAATAFPVRDGDGGTVGGVLLLRDVTEQHRMREQLMQSEKMSALGLLISGVAHEINNPLAGILGFAELAQRHDAPPRVRRDLEKIQVLGDRVRRIVRNLLSFARAYPPERTRVSLNALVEETLALRSYDHSVSNIRVEPALGTQPHALWADPHQLQQVLMNLVINAEQAMKGAAGKGTLRISTRACGDGLAEIVVEDDGPGIPPENLSRIFDPFFTTKPAGVGTGLGLSLVHGIVRDHGGTIRAENRPEGGARFRVTLPVNAPPLAAASEEGERVPSGSGRAVLVVDDEIDVLDVASRFLSEGGYRVVTAPTVDRALELLAESSVDLVLADLRMPGRDGKDLLSALRARTLQAPIRVAFMTGDVANGATKELARHLGVEILAKPFTSRELLEFVGGRLASESSVDVHSGAKVAPQ